MNIVVAYPKSWGPLTPSQQCTAYGDSIMSNQFEPLVKIGSDHLVYPLLAKSWDVSDDLKIYTFKIDTSKHFSNGVKLSAAHFKRSWEDGLLLEMTSHNVNTVEVLSDVDGFDEFVEKKTIRGIEVLDDETLRVTFKRPLRLALDHLSGYRLSAFIKDGDSYVGTGRYIIKATEDKDLIHLVQNPYHPDYKNLSSISVKVVSPDIAMKALDDGEIDAYEFAFKGDFRSVCEGKRNSNLSCASGLEFSHEILLVNSKQGRFFEDGKLRKALQYLIHSKIGEVELPPSFLTGDFKASPQIYLPLQKGVLESGEVNRIISEGEKYLDELVENSIKNPLKFYYSDDGSWFTKMLQRAGVRLSEDSGRKDWSELLNMIYKTSEMDLYLGGMSIVNGDPDGIYHALGEKGAILSPMIYRKEVGKLLEEGRSIIDPAKIDNHYKKVSRAVLEDVPIVHLGFLHGMSVYRNDRVRNIMDVKNREENRLHFYRKL